MKKGRTLLALWTVLWFVLLSAGCGHFGRKEAPVTTQEIEAHIRFLSDDLLEGRAIGSRGLALAALYQENHFRGLGLDPLFDGSYRQSFELKGARPDPRATLEVISSDMILEPRIFDDFVLNSSREDCPEGVEGELVYGGYLIQAPERDWDDIKGVDLKGKVLLVEINEPGNYPGGIFDGEDMTYYGRWTYKFEKAAELGATGVLIIHNTKGAAYGWEVVRNSWSRVKYFLPEQPQELFFHGWVHGQAAESILRLAGFDREELRARAEKGGFDPVPLNLVARVRQRPSFLTATTENVAAILRGRKKVPEERFIILSAHYDHLGKDETREGDQIFNGAVDNCSASATLLALARYYAQNPRKVSASLVFAAVSAEEEGLLGSDYFVRHLPFPAGSVLGNINLEMTNVWGETKDVFAIGAKHSDLDDVCRKAAKKMGLDYIPEMRGELGFFFRSDQLSFARGGIPAVWLHQGIVSRGKDKDFAKKKFEEYQRNKYHQVTDEIEADWDLRGTVQIARWAQEIVSLLDKAKDMPQFKESSPFRKKGVRS